MCVYIYIYMYEDWPCMGGICGLCGEPQFGSDFRVRSRIQCFQGLAARAGLHPSP